MKKKPETLFSVTGIKHRDYLHRPYPRSILGSTEFLTRVVLAENPHDALMLAFPNLMLQKFTKQVFMLWAVDVKSNILVLAPKQMEARYNLPFAKKYGEWGSMKQLRMYKVAEFTITNKTPFEDIIEDDKVISRRYLFDVQ